MKLLALDSCTLTAGVAVSGGETVLAQKQERVAIHSDALLRMVDETLKQAAVKVDELDGIVCTAGPGSFTGLRIGLATAKGLCYALSRPLVQVSSLAGLAARAPNGCRVTALLDAYQNELYVGRFVIESGLPRPLGEEVALGPDAVLDLLAHAPPDFLVGDGLLRYPQLLQAGVAALDDEPSPRPADILRLGAAKLCQNGAEDSGLAAPTYLRASAAEVLKAKILQGK